MKNNRTTTKKSRKKKERRKEKTDETYHDRESEAYRERTGVKKRFLKESEGRGEGKMSRKQARYRMGPRDSSREQVKRGIKLAWSSSPGPPQGVQSR